MQPVDRETLFQPFDQAGEQLPALGEKLGQLLFVGLSLFVIPEIASFHGGPSFQRFGDPILY